MIIRNTLGRRIFVIINTIMLTVIGVVCLLPFVHLVAVSLSSQSATSANLVNFLPVGFNIASYKIILQNKMFLSTLQVSIIRVIVGTIANMVFVTLTAYPLAMQSKQLKGRNAIMWFFVISILFNGGLIPTYLVICKVGLMDSFAALIIPTVLPVWNMILMMNFFRTLPPSLRESAMIDGARHWTILSRIYIPISKPSIATISLFCIVFHWNAWFDGMIYINRPENQPLQTFIRSVVENGLNIQALAQQGKFDLIDKASDVTLRSAQVFIATAPVLLAYPFLQKYFTKGIIVGSVKG